MLHDGSCIQYRMVSAALNFLILIAKLFGIFNVIMKLSVILVKIFIVISSYTYL